MRTEDFDYELPPERIARVPAPRRSDARLLVLDREGGGLADRRIRDLAELLRPGDLLVRNDSRVRPARLRARRKSGGEVEILLVEPLPDGAWAALVRPGRKLRDGEAVTLHGSAEAVLEERLEEGMRRVRFPDEVDVEAFAEAHGRMPLPPYIARARGADPRDALDRERYQTVYARRTGSCAAPTAGLHFDGPLLARLRARGVGTAEITLHVGPGTFRPVKADRIEDHRLHAESYEVTSETAAAIEGTRARGGRIVAVGTTTVRVLESIAAEGPIRATRGSTRLFIHPPYRFRVVDALLTNFHLPRSSLLMLVAALAGREAVLRAYRHAVAAGYRFYSYGDAMLITG
jgi:S-adenosylmethionine:tRNA ribosyltransferase-isomerase